MPEGKSVRTCSTPCRRRGMTRKGEKTPSRGIGGSASLRPYTLRPSSPFLAVGHPWLHFARALLI